MKLTDVCSLEEWEALENEIHETFNFQGAVFDPRGIRVTSNRFSSNPLCPAIRAMENGQQFICSAAHAHMTQQVRKSGDIYIDACDAGMTQWAVPIFHGNTFLGMAGGCGLITEGQKVDPLMVSQIAGLSQEEIQALSPQIPVTTRSEIKAAVAHVEKRIGQLIQTQ
ncbi:MAG: PocR ligand-binding domain-containing protein [Desulfobacterales bacterium]|nr:PocR ligand-binding domain-containing protein [Desulfobacterales bacterium]